MSEKIEGTEEKQETAKKSSKKKTVKHRLFKDNGKYKDPVFVAVNGKGYMLERGKELDLPVEVWEVLMNAQDQLAEADKVMLNAAFKEP